MIFKHFRFICTTRIVLIAATVFLFFIFIFRTSLYAVTFITGLLIIVQIYSLIQYVEKTNKDLNRFFEAIRFEDFSQTFSISGLGTSFNELKSAFNDVLQKLHQTRAEKEEHYRYLQTVVQHVGIGLIAFQPDGKVELINKAARKILKVPRLQNIHDLEAFSKKLVQRLLRMKTGERALVRVQDNDELLQLVLYAAEFTLRGQRYTLVSIQNIQSELEEKEMEAWQNLIRVLTHEIMNSVTPIASLASTANDLLVNVTEDGGKKETALSTIDDVSGAVKTIEKRSQGLLRFVESYRKLTRLPKPDFQIFSIFELFDRIRQLMQKQITERNIEFQTDVDPKTLELTADPAMIEQVLINLVLNAVQATGRKRHAKISMTAGMDERGRIAIRVSDNGTGISKEAIDKIFIPFFTTKKEGSGIGLSLARQIMRLHRGSISVQSRPNEETVFTLRF
jgi:nitrogen fixation/metabolism regulation signal transduction histidine kinase